jgi:hypothetical protein
MCSWLGAVEVEVVTVVGAEVGALHLFNLPACLLDRMLLELELEVPQEQMVAMGSAVQTQHLIA